MTFCRVLSFCPGRSKFRKKNFKGRSLLLYLFVGYVPARSSSVCSCFRLKLTLKQIIKVLTLFVTRIRYSLKIISKSPFTTDVFLTAHRRMGRGNGSPPPPPPTFGQLRFFGQKEKFGQSQFLKKFPCFFIRRDRYFLF